MPGDTTLSELTRQLSSGRIRAVDLVDAALARADQPAAAHVFTDRFDADARAVAGIADSLRAQKGHGPFLGVPITVKDNMDLAGEVTRVGSRVLGTQPPAREDATVVTRLRRAGFVILGRTNMTEFAFSGLGINPHYGTPINPAFREPHIPGGSSTGAAVSVALDIAPVAIGSDTGGSVRIPAALCGIIGFKPTLTAITTAGVYPLSHSLDSVGVLAHTVADCAAVFDVIRDVPGALRLLRTLRGARLAVITNYVNDRIESEVAAAFQTALDRLATAGAEIVPVVLPELDELPAFNRNGTLVMAEAYPQLRTVVAGREDQCDARIITRITGGGAISAEHYAAMKQQRAVLQASANARLQAFDAYLMPTVPVIAPTIAALADDAPYHDANRLILRNPSVVNFLGGCAISLPCQAPGTAPVGLSVAALPGQDDQLLALAASIEAALRP